MQSSPGSFRFIIIIIFIAIACGVGALRAQTSASRTTPGTQSDNASASVVLVSADYAASPANRYIIVDAAQNAVTVTLPPATIIGQEITVIVQNGAHAVTVKAIGGDLQDAIIDYNNARYMGGGTCGGGESVVFLSLGTHTWYVTQSKNSGCANWSGNAGPATPAQDFPPGNQDGQTLQWDSTNHVWVRTDAITIPDSDQVQVLGGTFVVDPGVSSVGPGAGGAGADGPRGGIAPPRVQSSVLPYGKPAMAIGSGAPPVFHHAAPRRSGGPHVTGAPSDTLYGADVLQNGSVGWRESYLIARGGNDATDIKGGMGTDADGRKLELFTGSLLTDDSVRIMISDSTVGVFNPSFQGHSDFPHHALVVGDGSAVHSAGVVQTGPVGMREAYTIARGGNRVLDVKAGMGVSGDGNSLQFFTGDSFLDGASVRLTIDPTGNVGVGTDAPVGRLESDISGMLGAGTYYGVKADAESDATGKLYGVYAKAYGTDDQTVGVYGEGSSTSTGAGYGGWFKASGIGQNYGLVVENGNAGFGTTTPLEKIHVANGNIKVSSGGVSVSGGDITSTNGNIVANNGSNVIVGNGGNVRVISGASTGDVVINSSGTHGLVLQDANNKCYRITVNSAGALVVTPLAACP